MANKYLIHGETYCGDGTTSSAAASNGAAGAWNNINVLTGTAPAYGSLAAGDVVYIRSKTSAAADITITVGAATNLGSSSATETVPITWILDNGVTWSGIDGTLTFSYTGAYTLTPRDYNRFYALGSAKWVLSCTGNYAWQLAGAKISTLNWYVDMHTNNTSANIVFGVGNGFHTNLKIKYYTNQYRPILLNNGAEVFFYNLDVEFSNASASGKTVFAIGSYSGHIVVIGGRIWGAGATANNYVNFAGDTYYGLLELYGVSVPSVMQLQAAATASGPQKVLFMEGADDGLSAVSKDVWGALSTRYDEAYPYLNAVLPDSGSTPWSVMLYLPTTFVPSPAKYAINKFYSGSAATKTITLEFLVTNTTGNAGAWLGVTPAGDNCWVSISYVNNSTGLREFLTTQLSSSALASSSAAWSQTTYGSASFDKKKLSITTPNAIKQNTEITVGFVSTLKSASTKDMIILCPDVQLT